MEVFYLLASMGATLLTSTLLSLLLLLRILLPVPRRAPSGAGAGAGAARLYEGRVRHARRRPAAHAFEYPVRYALVDLDRLPLPGHRSAAEARRVAATSGPVHLLTIPKSVGYEQNPLSIYYCYDSVAEEQDGEVACSAHLKMCIAEVRVETPQYQQEVTNTPWGERVMFTFRPGSDLVAKPLHVSPFMDMFGNWSIHAGDPGDSLSVAISVQHPKLGNYFTATLHTKLVGQFSDSVSLATLFWLMPHKVAAWIYWEALKLWLKNIKFLEHPRYLNPKYRDEVLKHDLEISSSCSFLQKQKLSKPSGNAEDKIAKLSYPERSGDANNTNRWCVWRDAQWPWS